MGFTSVFGTMFAAPIWALAVLMAPLAVNAQAVDANLDVSVTGLRNAKGKIQICLTANPKAFPDCSKDANARKLTVAATNATNIRFEAVKPGTYALSLIHDENGNGKLDTTVAIPKEGFGFSRNPKISFGPPSFKAASFVISGDSSQSVKMKYMF